MDSVVGEKGLFVYRTSSHFFLQRLNGSMSGDNAREFNNMETWAIIKSFFCNARRLRKFTQFWQKTLGEHVPSCATVKNWMAHFKRGDFSTYVAPRPGLPKTVTTLDIID